MRGHTLAGIIIILVGLGLFLGIPVGNFIVAVIIVWVGVKILTGQRHPFRGFGHEVKGEIHENFLHRVLVFSGINTKFVTDHFEGARVVMVFGGGEIDATEIKTDKKEAEIELVAVFGGLKLHIPEGWAVKSEGVGIFGGFDIGVKSSAKPSVIVNIRGAAIFGGVEVVN